MKFRSPDGKDKRVALLTGHTAIIGSEWRELEPQFHSGAYAAGCISENMIQNTVLESVDPKVSKSLTEKADKLANALMILRGWIADNDMSRFNSDGKPKTVELSKELGYRIYNYDRDYYWEKYLEETQPSKE